MGSLNFPASIIKKHTYVNSTSAVKIMKYLCYNKHQFFEDFHSHINKRCLLKMCCIEILKILCHIVAGCFLLFTCPA